MYPTCYLLLGLLCLGWVIRSETTSGSRSTVTSTKFMGWNGWEPLMKSLTSSGHTLCIGLPKMVSLPPLQWVRMETAFTWSSLPISSSTITPYFHEPLGSGSYSIITICTCDVIFRLYLCEFLNSHFSIASKRSLDKCSILLLRLVFDDTSGTSSSLSAGISGNVSTLRPHKRWEGLYQFARGNIGKWAWVK